MRVVSTKYGAGSRRQLQTISQQIHETFELAEAEDHSSGGEVGVPCDPSSCASCAGDEDTR